MPIEPLLFIELAALGLATGFLAGLLGIGGGMIMVPFISTMLVGRAVAPGLAVKMAIATSMATIIFTSMSSVRAHHKKGAVRWDIVKRLAPGIVLGIAAPVGELAGHEWPASLTVIDEASSSFFHGTAGRCFTQVTGVTPLGTAGRSFRVAGELYCAGALGAVNGEQAITLGDSRYAGRVDLEGP